MSVKFEIRFECTHHWYDSSTNSWYMMSSSKRFCSNSSLSKSAIQAYKKYRIRWWNMIGMVCSIRKKLIPFHGKRHISYRDSLWLEFGISGNRTKTKISFNENQNDCDASDYLSQHITQFGCIEFVFHRNEMIDRSWIHNRCRQWSIVIFHRCKFQKALLRLNQKHEANAVGFLNVSVFFSVGEPRSSNATKNQNAQRQFNGGNVKFRRDDWHFVVLIASFFQRSTWFGYVERWM